MRNSLKAVVLALALTAAGVGGALAAASDLQPGQFEEKLKTYDPAAVEAARAYARTYNMKGLMLESAPRIAAGVSMQVKSKNPNLTDDQVKQFSDAFMQSMLVDNSDVLEQQTILLMLDVFSKDELLALNQFYSSPTGQGILKKMPTLMGRMSDISQVMQTYIIPRALDAAVANLHAHGVEVRK